MAVTEMFDGGWSPRPVVSADPTSSHYDMTGDKLMFMFSHETFQKSHDFMYPLRPRPETDQEAAKVKKTFEDVGFKVEEPFKDFTYGQLKQKLTKLCKEDHETTSCVAFVFLTHGDADGKMAAADKMYFFRDVVDPVLQAPSLAGKPKLFFFPVTTPGFKPELNEISFEIFYASEVQTTCKKRVSLLRHR